MIPKKIHYIWVGGNEMPKFIENCIESWKKFCPDYEIIRWDESNLDVDKFQFAKDAYDNKKWAFFSDVHRFDILKNHGGIYLDVDVELYESLDKFLDNDFFTGFEDNEFVAPGLIMGSVPNAKVCNDIIDIYNNLKFDKNNLITVCQITTEYLKDNYGLVLNGKTQKLKNNTLIYSSDYFCPKNFKTGEIKKTENTVSIHHYYASWVPKPTLFDKIKNGIKNCIKAVIGKKNVEKIREKRKTKRDNK